jgi:hypothetical protein
MHPDNCPKRTVKHQPFIALENISQSDCVAMSRDGRLICYETRMHRYVQDIRGRWFKVKGQTQQSCHCTVPERKLGT